MYETPRKSIIDHYVEIVERNQGQICFVHLYCDMAVLAQRVQSNERHQHGKITDVDLLHQFMDQLQEPFATVRGYNSLSLNTGEVMPKVAAEKIICHYSL